MRSEIDDSYLQAQQEQEEREYKLWLYEIAVIDEINKELNCEKRQHEFLGICT